MHFLVLALRTPDFDPDILPGHRAFLEELRERGRLAAHGPFIDQSGGAYVLCAESIAEAEAIAATDPLGRSGAAELAVWGWAVEWPAPS
jgi:uncharacterized protein YciI